MGTLTCSKIGELEAVIEGMRRKVLLERALKEQLAQRIYDSQQEMAFEKETAQAVEAVLIKKSKNLQEYVEIPPFFTALLIPLSVRLLYMNRQSNNC
jgi:nitrate reductase cytochrome c-type subunit